MHIQKRNPWNILEPVVVSDTPEVLIPNGTHHDLKRFNQSHPLAIDFETRGTQAAYMFLDADHPQVCHIQSIGISDGTTALNIDRRDVSHFNWMRIFRWLRGCSYLFGHNIIFDSSFSYVENLLHHKQSWDKWDRVPPEMFMNWKCCTYVLFRLLAGEGFNGQRWGLKYAQKELLGWKNTNEKDLDEWLIQAGHYSGSLKKELDTPEGRLEAYWTFDAKGKRKISPDKSQMFRAPPPILGHYCALDAYSTWQLLDKVLAPAIEKKFNDKMQSRIWEHVDEWMTLIRLHVSQQLNGMRIDRDRLATYKEDLQSRIDAVRDEFLVHPDVKDWVNLYHEMVVGESKEPEKFLKLKIPEEKKEPPRMTKAGKPSKNWDKWNERMKLRQEMLAHPEKFQVVSKNWINWEEKVRLLNETHQFSLTSPIALKWLFYEWLGMEVKVTTKSDGPSTDEKAKLGWGEVGQLLIKFDGLSKEMTYVNGTLAESAVTGRVHVRMKCPGTVTLRLAGGSDKSHGKDTKFNCYSEDTEVITTGGWKYIKDLVKEDTIWQSDEHGNGSWTSPLAIHTKEADELIEIGSKKQGTLLVTKDHKMVWHDYRGKNPIINQAYEGIPKGRRYLPTTCKPSSNKDIDPEKERILREALCLQADGSLKKDGTYQLGLRKERKIQEASKLFGPPKYYKKDARWNTIHHHSEFLCGTKVKNLNLVNLEPKYVHIVALSLAMWDGHYRGTKRKAFEYYTGNEHNADEVQSYIVRSGWSATKRKYADNKYMVYIVNRQHTEIREHHINRVPYKGRVYCPEVSDGFLLVRRQGRVFLSGNCQQQPKVRGFLECFIADEGKSIIQDDFTALENVVLAEVTRDKSLLKLYGPNSLKTDAYIWNGSQLPVLGERFREKNYDPENPCPEAVKRIKKENKTDRGIAKKVTLGKNYGMGANKLRDDLALEGITLSKEDAFSIIDGLNLLYKQAYLDYPQALEEEWLTNRGFIINSVGLPCSVSHDNLKDLVNRATQSAGHAITIKSACILEEVLIEQGLTMMWWPGAEERADFVAPWILDFHDEHMIEAFDEKVQIIKDSYVERLRRLNEWLDPYVPIEGGPESGPDLAQFKCED